MPGVEALIRATGADIRLGGDKAFYAPGLDYIQTTVVHGSLPRWLR